MIRVTIIALINIGLAWTTLTAADAPVRVLVWDEQQPEQKQAYGDKFLGETIAAYLGSKNNIQVKSVALSAPEQGLDEATLNQTDVMVMWAHKRSKEVKDENAERVMNRMIAGRLGLIAIHSVHWTKPYVRLMQERAKADAIAKVLEAERANAKWTYLNQRISIKDTHFSFFVITAFCHLVARKKKIVDTQPFHAFRHSIQM